MKTTILLAVSALALGACGGSEVETAETDTAIVAPATETTRTAGTQLGEQPPLEGDSPFVDEADVTESRMGGNALGETYADTGTYAGSYELAVDGEDAPRLLTVDADGRTGTLDGEPVELSMDGDRFRFDAPNRLGTEEELMTYSGTFADGGVSDGVIEAQGDGSATAFTARRSDAMDTGLRTPVTNDVERAAEQVGQEAGELGQDAVQGTERALDGAQRGVEGAYDRATDGSDATEALDPND